MSYESQTALANRAGFANSFTAEYDNNQTAATVITPASGKKLSIKGVYVGTGATSGKIRLFFQSSGNTVVTLYAADEPGYIPLFVEGAVDEPLKMTTSFGADTAYFVLVNYT
jgi:hypothetical protein